MLDPQNESFDRRLASHLVSLYYRNATRHQTESIVSVYITSKGLAALQSTRTSNRNLRGPTELPTISVSTIVY